MTKEDRLKMIMEQKEFAFIKDIPQEQLWKLFFAISFISDESPTQPCEDCVSREWLLEQFAAHVASGYAESEYDAGIYANLVKGAPSVQPERAKGEWIATELFYDGESRGAIIKCNRCGNEMKISPQRFEQLSYCEKFCSLCGAEMKGVQKC